jgi:hypothetical protein
MADAIMHGLDSVHPAGWRRRASWMPGSRPGKTPADPGPSCTGLTRASRRNGRKIRHEGQTDLTLSTSLCHKSLGRQRISRDPARQPRCVDGRDNPGHDN